MAQNPFERLRSANPVPRSMVEGKSDDHVGLLADIRERAVGPAFVHDGPVEEPPPERPRAWVVAAAIAAMALVAVGLLVTLDRSRWPVAGSSADRTMAMADAWVDAMNRGAVDEALGLLSPEAVCDLRTPTGEVETCEQHLGYIAAIGTHFEKRSCRDAAPHRCSFDLTSDLHATLGYPNHTLQMNVVFRLDERELLQADFFDGADTSDAYYPGDAGEFWAWLANENPHMGVDVDFGPDVYDAAAGEAVMEAAGSFTDPSRIATLVQTALDDRDASGMLQCGTPDGSRPCSDLIAFLGGIDADLDLDCDTAGAVDFTIPCEVTMDSAVHRALGTGPSLSELTIQYRGGGARGFEFDLRLAGDQERHDEMLEYARGYPELYGARPVWNAQSGPGWVEAAEELAGG